MVMRQSGSNRVERQTRNRWKETKGNRQRGTVRLQETERRDAVEERGEETLVKRQRRGET